MIKTAFSLNLILIIFSIFIIGHATMSNAAWNSKACEDARNKLLAPLRQAEIKKCQSDPKNDPAWCERFYADYGNATPRPGGGVYPRMFDDIPECKK